MNIFDTWNVLKQKLHQKKNTKTIKERDVFFLSLGENIGDEQNGKGESFLRPVLVIRKFSPTLFLGVPLTSQKKKDSVFYAEFSLKEKRSTALLSQVRLFDARRIEYFYTRLGRDSFSEVKKKLIELIQ